MSDMEKRYTQIEKEALATTWACDKFSEYVLGRKFTKDLGSLSPRILCFHFRMMRFQDLQLTHSKKQPSKKNCQPSPSYRITTGQVDKY